MTLIAKALQLKVSQPVNRSTLSPLLGERFNQLPAPARHCLFSSSSSFRQLSNARRRSGATHRRVIVGYCISSSRLLRATLSPLDFLHCIARSWTTWIRVTRGGCQRLPRFVDGRRRVRWLYLISQFGKQQCPRGNCAIQSAQIATTIPQSATR